MSHTTCTDDVRTMAALYSLGALSASERSEFEQHIAQGCEVCRRELLQFESTAANLPYAAPEVAPPPALRSRILERVQNPMPGVHVIRTTEGKWMRTNFPGVTVKTLYYDKQTAMVTNLVRMEPRSSYPPHHHTAMEQCLVLEGDVRQDGMVLGPGDYSRNEPDSDHGRIETENGCLLLLISCAKDELLD